VGDEVILIGAVIGARGERSITAWEQARLALTIPYEVLTGLSKRLPRRYVE
jgi:alanine racemase